MTRSLRLLAGFVFALSVMLITESTAAQTSDGARYTIRIDPFMQLTALGADRTAIHPLTPSNITFAGQTWFARTSSSTGSTIQWTTDHSFWNTADPSYRRDARLRLTRIVGSAISGWQFDTVQDQTNTVGGDETALVQVSSQRAGNAIIWMDVTFITGNLPTLRGGNYEMTVIGTISAN